MVPRHKQSNVFWIFGLLVLLISIACLYWITIPEYQVQGQQSAERLGQSLLSENLSDQINESAVSGGRAKGGTFSTPAPSRSLPAPSSGGYGGGYSGGYSRSPSYYPVPAPVYIPIPSGGYAPSPTYAPASGGLNIELIFLLLVLGFAVLPIVLNYLKLGSGGTAAEGSTSELTNEIVTVTELQIALLAQAREIQRDLTILTEQADLDSKAGLSELLRETVLALLRSPECWTHAKVLSQTVRSREEASRLFEKLSIQERSKFTTETLVNVGGQVRKTAVPVSNEEADPAAFIVVTLIIGTADDRPILSAVRSTADLRQALQRIGAISADYLLVYELLWSPQAEPDTLSREELIAQYPDLVQI